ncbi:MAG TPA: transposase [Solimonas sp.]|nr:transposase [Solimonas sp.]
MPNFRRPSAPGTEVFFTVVAHQRRPILTEPAIREALRAAINTVRTQRPFHVDAWVLMPDHLHCIWSLPESDGDFATRWSAIKRLVTQACATTAESPSRQRRREGSLWQRRFWEHQLRDDLDRERHFDYLHWNPVKHGLVRRVADWPYSTFHRWVRDGVYPADWGGDISESRFPVQDFGE